MQNVKKLDGNFWAIYVGNMHAYFQVSSFTGVGGEWGDRRMHTWCQAFLKRSVYKICKILPPFARDG